MIQIRLLSALALVAIAAAACGGGGGGGSVPTTPGGNIIAGTTPAPGTTPAAVPSGFAPTAFKITMPKGTYAAATTRRTGQTIGAGTQSIVLTLLQQNGSPTTGAPQSFGLTSSSTGCAVNTTTLALTCTLSINAPIGQDVFLAQTYDGAGGTGNLTGSGAVALSVGINSTNTASIVLNAQVASVLVVSASSFLGSAGQLVAKIRNRGSAAVRRPAVAVGPANVSSTPIYIVASDSAGNAILNPSAFSAPIYLQLAFDQSFNFTSTADVTLSVTYGVNDPSPCAAGQTVSTAVWYGSLAVCSPSDLITASLSASGGPDPSDFAIIFGVLSPGSLVPMPALSGTPLPLPSPPATNSYAFIQVAFPTSPPAQLPIQVQ